MKKYLKLLLRCEVALASDEARPAGPAFLIGGIFFLAGLGIAPLLSVLDIQMPIIASAVEFAAGFVGALLMDISVIVLGVGLALIVISFISDAIARRREN